MVLTAYFLIVSRCPWIVTCASGVPCSTTKDIVSFAETKKRSRRNFLCSIICCLGKKRSGGKEKDGVSGAPASGAVDAHDGRGGISLGPGASLSPQNKAKQLLPELRSEDAGKKCIVIDLDETLVHSSFKVLFCFSIFGKKRFRNTSKIFKYHWQFYKINF